MRIVCISDTHCSKPDLPEGDILIHAGDLTYGGTHSELKQQFRWLGENKHKYRHIIVVPGNHDRNIETQPYFYKVEAAADKLILLNEEEITIEGVKFFGSPITPFFRNWAFNRYSEDIQTHWDRIPDDVNVLITHGPALGILDHLSVYERVITPEGVAVKKFVEEVQLGCPKLLEAVKRKKHLKASICGHIHNGYGHRELDGVQYVNCSIMTEQYTPTNKPIIIEI